MARCQPALQFSYALRQAPAEMVITDKNVNRIRIGGVQQRCSLVVLKHFHGAPER